MQLLDTWRDSVVRDGNRLYITTETGSRFPGGFAEYLHALPFQQEEVLRRMP